MVPSGRILVIDDDRDFVAVYDEMFKGQGLVVTAAYSTAEATQVLETAGSGIDVVLLDQKLHGHGGPDSGLEMISRIEQLAPFAKTIVVRGTPAPTRWSERFASASTTTS